MGVKVATNCFQWSQLVLPHSLSYSQTLASAFSSPSFKERNRGSNGGGALVCRFVHKLGRSNLFAVQSTWICKSRSCEYPVSPARTIRRACSASLESFSDEEFSKKIEDLALRVQLSDDNDDQNSKAIDSESEMVFESADDNSNSFSEESSRVNFLQDQTRSPVSKLDTFEPPWLDIWPDTPDWHCGNEIIPADIERKANRVDLPFSIRIIKKKLQRKEGFREAGESAYCSVNQAFSSMVFIIQELHSYTLQMREILFYQDLQGILARVRREMHASFVWLFQQVFSHTPTLMVYVMILLANFTVYSIGNNTAIVVTAPSPAATTEIASVSEIQDQKNQKFDSSAIKTFSVSSSGGKATSIGGNNGSGGKFRPVAIGADGDGGFDGSDHYHCTILPDGASQLSSLRRTGETESVAEQETRQEDKEDASLRNSIVEEAWNRQAGSRGKALDHNTTKRFVSSVSVKIETDDYAEYLRTELLYQTGLSQEPNNPLLLANYAQFLCLVAHDYDRAEEYFKRALGVEPPDAEAYDKYATFLWKVRNDLWGAEETYLEAISAEPTNSYYAANYAHFLWNTGGEDTCFPLTSPHAPEEL